ncbi:MAG: ornithine carbamoyltransferase [Sphaerochaetaceae bacterium]
MNLTNRSLLTLKDYTAEELMYLIELATDLKAKRKRGEVGDTLKGKSLVLLFDKPSTRTRCAFEVAASEEGAHVTYLTNSQMGKKESIEDTAKVLGRYYNAIQYRGSDQRIVEQLARFSGVPVYNGLTDDDHPTQVLADFLTIVEHSNKPLSEIKFVYVGDGRNNMVQALMIGASKVGMHFVVATDPTLRPTEDFLTSLKEDTHHSGATIEVEYDPHIAVKDADVIYTDVWFSMGEEDQMASRIKILSPYKVTMDLIQASNNDNVLFLHCLPAFHDTHTEIGSYVYEKFGLTEMEVTDEVFRSRHSVVFDEAENRLHTIKALLVATM